MRVQGRLFSQTQAVCIAHVAPHPVAVHIWRQVVDGALEADVEAQLLCSRLDLQQHKRCVSTVAWRCHALSGLRLADVLHTAATVPQGCFGDWDLAI